jgi:GntP family gluconate:H+ symporter
MAEGPKVIGPKPAEAAQIAGRLFFPGNGRHLLFPIRAMGVLYAGRGMLKRLEPPGIRMNPLWILLIGMTIVIGGILILRMHAFLSLIAAALVVALLTPASYVYRFSLRAGAAEIAGSDGSTVTLRLKPPPPVGSPLLLLGPADTSTGYRQLAIARITGPGENGTSRAALDDPSVRVQAGDFVADTATEAAARKAAEETIGERIADGFGATAREIGILIAMAAILGKTLMESGAAERIVDSCRRLLGDDRVALAFLVSAFVLAALVLSDTTFYLLIPLAQAMRLRNGRDYTLYILAIVAGATMTHSLVPPAPGPVFVAAALHVPLGTMILGGAFIGAIASTSGFIYALWANRRWDIPLRTSLAIDANHMRLSDPETLPPLWSSLIPVLLPITLIAARAVADSYPPAHPVLLRLLKTLGEKNVALSLGAAAGLILVAARRKVSKPAESFSASVGHGLSSAGVMVLIIAGGGAFGYVLRQTDIAATLKELLPASKLALIPLAFLVAAAVRTAQGSAIVAMVTAAGIVAPIAAATDLGYNAVYLATAIGCGSKPVMWMNDAGFWIIGKTSGFTETETLKTATVLMIIMAVMGLLATMLAASLFPLV